jgi:hypothetical protein
MTLITTQVPSQFDTMVDQQAAVVRSASGVKQLLCFSL